jgi:hypothetical protein
LLLFLLFLLCLSHKSHKRHRFPTAKQQQLGSSPNTPPSQSRCARRKNQSLLQASHHATWQNSVDSYEESKTCSWIATHVWHAKRFHMLDLFNWKVPMLHSNRGAKAALRLGQESCVVQDATWCNQPIWFKCRANVATLLCQIIPSFTSWPASLDKVVVSNGMVHARGAFPGGAIGPVSWMISPKLLDDDGDVTSDHDWFYMYLFVHRSIHELVFSELSALLSPGNGPFKFVKGGLACLRLRGNQVESCLKKGLTSSFDLDQTESQRVEAYLEAQPSHFSTLSIKCPTHQDGQASMLHIVRQSPRDSTLKQNNGVSGCDVYCHLSVARLLFQAFVLKGCACPIGVVEDAHLCLEAQPPLPVFPRDFPDTHQGSLYWADSANEWTTVRRYLEGGIGRISPDSRLLRAIDWKSKSVLGDQESAVGPAVVVRGDYGQPFRAALAASASFQQPTSAKGRRRNRRAQLPPNTLVKAPCLPEEQASKFRGSCNALLQSLSLPALLVCHIQIPGRGALLPGDSLVSTHSSAELGFVSTGSFSPSRGLYHGIGIVGAASFLKDIAATDREHPSFIVRKGDGSKEIQLGVTVRKESGEVFGTLSLLL